MHKPQRVSRPGRMLPDRRAARLIARRANWLSLVPTTRSSVPLSQLETVLERHAPDAILMRDSVAARALRSAVEALVADARAAEPERVEPLLIELRCAWRDFPRVRGLASLETRDALWSRIVTVCCEEFYHARHGAPRRAPRHLSLN